MSTILEVDVMIPIAYKDFLPREKTIEHQTLADISNMLGPDLMGEDLWKRYCELSYVSGLFYCPYIPLQIFTSGAFK